MEFEKVVSIISEVLGTDPETISEDSKFIDDLGADSLDVMQIIMGIEQEFDIEIDENTAKTIVTVGDAVEKIKGAIADK
jgi:acyl carrier protein